MSLQAISLVLACLGTLLAIANQVQRWWEKRKAGSVEEHRLDIDGLQVLTKEQRTEIDRIRGDLRQALQELEEERDGRRVDRARIAELETKLAEVQKDLRKAHDTIDAIQVEREMRRDS